MKEDISKSLHLGAYSRGYLPTRDEPNRRQMVTFRLNDSLPKGVLIGWQEEMKLFPDEARDRKLREKVQTHLDAGYGTCLLGRPEAARIVAEAFKARDSHDYELLAWVVMPNHVHVLIRQVDGAPLHKIVSAWKGVTSHAINKLLDRKGPLWNREYFDRYMRDDDHFARAVAYIEDNPVNAGLCRTPGEWIYSSAYRK
ncbi:MAG: transposase [Armatimonadota bacterium]